MILDTCFLIDFERDKPETKAFFAANASEPMCYAVITAGELACGYDPSNLAGLWHRLRHFQLLDVTHEVAECYAKAYRQLRSAGRMIGANDLWIASVALANRLPVVTRNLGEFTRVPGLHVVGY